MSTDTPALFVLNLDAELELEALARGRSYVLPAKLAAQLRSVRPRVEASLRALGVIREGELVVSTRVDLAALSAPPSTARFWCPTPGARALARAGGARVEDDALPPPEVLVALNQRGFSAALGPTLPGERFVTCVQDAVSAIAAVRAAGADAVLLKRALGVAGRGQRVLRRRAREQDPLAPEDARWIAASMPLGLQVEPLVELELEFVVHGWLSPDGEAQIAPPRVQEMRAGAWVSTRRPRPGELDETTSRELVAEARRVGAALASAGYHGPFGVDAFRYLVGETRRMRWRSEINARYTTAWSLLDSAAPEPAAPSP